MAKPETLLRRVFPPMLATLAQEAPRDEDQWTYELKYDGFRAVAAVSGGEVAMWSRNELDLAARFPNIAGALSKWKVPEVVIDAEVVALDEKGAPRFQLLQQGRREMLFVFDILWLDGRDLRRLPYDERRRILEKTLRKSPSLMAPSVVVEGPGAEALARAAGAGYEGLIAKRTSSVYEGRRSREWLKLKAQNQQELVIVGWQPSTHSSKEIGSLHLAVREDDGSLRYAGKVGTGFSYKQRVWFRDELARDVLPKTEVRDAPRIRTATWVRPRLVGQVSFTEWTADGRLRHPSFLGLRDDKSPEDVVREKPAVVVLTSPERVLFPRDGITKADLAAYYEEVAGAMNRTLRDRPLALEHWNQGIDKPSWFQQNIGKEGPDWLTTLETPTRAGRRSKVRHLVADTPDALRWLAQMSVITVHMWHSRGASLEQPDWMLFDLDPAKGKGIEQAIEAALVMRKLLEELNLPSVPKTSGKRGIHLFVPLAKGHTYDEMHDFACTLAAAVSAKVPGMTVERSLSKRRGRLYLDCEQNAYGKTVVAPYSPRAIDGAPVSAPLKWSEVTRKLDPLEYTIRTMPKRLQKVGDLFEDALRKGAKLPKLG